MSKEECGLVSALTPAAGIPGRPTPLPSQLLEAELAFYGDYPWSLNVFPTVEEIRSHLQREIARLEEVPEDWRRREVSTNIFLLACAITQSVDDFLLGTRYDFSKAAKAKPALAWMAPAVEAALSFVEKLRELTYSHVCLWRQRWNAAVIDFTRALQSEEADGERISASSTARLASLLLKRLPVSLLRRRVRVPSAFHSQSLTALDSQALARKFVGAFPDRKRRILVLGLRTAGSYFAPLICAYLRSEGYQKVDCVTVRSTTGISLWEAREIKRSARDRALVAIADEPMTSGTTVVEAVRFLCRSGFSSRDIVALVPNHPARRGWTWSSKVKFPPATQITVLLLEGSEWHRRQLLKPEAVERPLQEYFLARGYRSATLEFGPRWEEYSANLKKREILKGHVRFKAIYQLRLEDAEGKIETRYVLAKTAGWGWLGYHAFLQAHRLSTFVPPILGLRDGILYSEWLPESEENPQAPTSNRSRIIDTLGDYVAARVRSLNLAKEFAADLAAQEDPVGLGLLADPLSRAYHNKITAALKRGSIREMLSRLSTPCPTLIDGKMQPIEWIRGTEAFLKTDFEHHGLGKPHLNATDPGYDLAQAILSWELTEEEEKQLLDRYVEKCEDAGVAERLFLYKLLAGTWEITRSLEILAQSHLSHHHREYSRRYVQATGFLTLHTTRFCGSFCRPPQTRRWHNPLVALDIDGVLDAWIFGFPSTTKAGIEAVSLLHSHDFAVCLNTARSLAEVQEYCKAYGFVGGVAEYGSALWDAVRDRECVLVSQESLCELEKVKSALRELPGIFLNDRYKYSIRVYRLEEEKTLPVPVSFIQDLLAKLGVQTLRIYQTGSDTAILAKGLDKGTGLQALVSWTGILGSDTVAIGDSEADLAMFRVAKRSFAPAQIKCREAAQLLGCKIADQAYQPGLLGIVRSLVHADGKYCDRCRSLEGHWPKGKNPFMELLKLADRREESLLLRALADRSALRTFTK